MNGETAPSNSESQGLETVSFWSSFTAWFQPHQDKPTKPAAPDDTQCSSTLSPEEKTPRPKPRPAAPLTPEERERLSKILGLLSKRHQEEKTKNTEDQSTGEKKESSPFLLELAEAAATVASEAATNNPQNNDNENTNTFDDDPEAAIQRILKAGKRNEALEQRRQDHLQRVETLVKEYPNLLLEPLQECRKELEDSLANSNREKFLSVMSNMLGKEDEERTFDFFMGILNKNHGNDICKFLQLCFHLAVADAYLTVREDKHKERLLKEMAKMKEPEKNQTDPAIQAMLNSFQAAIDSNSNEHDNFLQCQRQQAPSLLSSMSLCMHQILFPSLEEADENKTGWLLPTSLDREEGSFLAKESWLFLVASTIPPDHHKKVGPSWHSLYSSHSEGFNLSTLEHSLAGYHGPTLLLVEAFDKETKTNQTFGAFASQPWTKQSSPDYYGNSDSYLFQLQPQFQVWRAKPSGLANYQYFYFDNRATPLTLNGNSKKYENGLGLGGSRKRPRFFVSASLDTCHLGSHDATFQGSADDGAPLTTEPLWDLQSLEIWGVGGESAMKALLRHKSVEEAHLQKARQVDKAAFLNDFRSGLIESKMFGHREEMRNRDGGCLLDCHDEEDDGQWQIGAPR